MSSSNLIFSSFTILSTSVSIGVSASSVVSGVSGSFSFDIGVSSASSGVISLEASTNEIFLKSP